MSTFLIEVGKVAAIATVAAGAAVFGAICGGWLGVKAVEAAQTIDDTVGGIGASLLRGRPQTAEPAVNHVPADVA